MSHFMILFILLFFFHLKINKNKWGINFQKSNFHNKNESYHWVEHTLKVWVHNTINTKRTITKDNKYIKKNNSKPLKI